MKERFKYGRKVYHTNMLNMPINFVKIGKIILFALSMAAFGYALSFFE